MTADISKIMRFSCNISIKLVLTTHPPRQVSDSSVSPHPPAPCLFPLPPYQQAWGAGKDSLQLESSVSLNEDSGVCNITLHVHVTERTATSYFDV